MNSKIKSKIKVLLGLSGGVDSAVALHLLQQNPHYEVDCLFMRNWDSFVNNEVNNNYEDCTDVCPQEIDFIDAQSVANKLNAKLLRVDFIKEYWDDVFTYFLDEYKRGRTPNPDVVCNNEIKFKAFLNYALNNGYDYIATGHYAKNDKEGNLYIPLDKTKDQSYFLAQLTKDQLAKAIFPLSNITKEKVREIASKLGLIVFDKKDSTGICFIGERNINNFLANYFKPNPGDIIYLSTGEKIGTHSGLFNYTIGQRKGLGFGTVNGQKGPWFVVGKNHQQNLLYVSNKSDDNYLMSNKCIIYQAVFRKDFTAAKCTLRFRHLQKLVPGKIEKINNSWVITYQKSRAITPGQLVCVYQGKCCLGGGFVDEVYYDAEKRDY